MWQSSLCAGVFALPVLILTTTVVCVKLQVGLSHVMGLQKVVHHANNGVCRLSSLRSLINKVVDLQTKKAESNSGVFVFYLEHSYLSWYSLAAHPKDSTLSWYQKVHRTWLLWITVIMLRYNHHCMLLHVWPHLLGHIKWKVYWCFAVAAERSMVAVVGTHFRLWTAHESLCVTACRGSGNMTALWWQAWCVLQLLWWSGGVFHTGEVK